MLVRKINLWHLLIGVLALIGVTIQVIKYGVNMFLYFTTLSNTLVAGYYLYKSVTSNKRPTAFKGSVVMAILLTGLVYHFMLASRAKDFHRVENYIVHYIVPISVFIDYIFTKGLKVNWKNPFQWVIIPLTYLLFSLFNGLVLQLPVPDNADSPFPYFFLNINKLGVQPVFIYVAVICVAYILLGYVLVFIKKIVK